MSPGAAPSRSRGAQALGGGVGPAIAAWAPPPPPGLLRPWPEFGVKRARFGGRPWGILPRASLAQPGWARCRRASSSARGLANNARGAKTGRRLPCPLGWHQTSSIGAAQTWRPALPKALALGPRQWRAGRRGGAAARPRRSLTGRSGCAVSSDPHKLFLAPRRAAGSPGCLRAARPRRLSVPPPSVRAPGRPLAGFGGCSTCGASSEPAQPVLGSFPRPGAPVLAAAARGPGGGRGGFCCWRARAELGLHQQPEVRPEAASFSAIRILGALHTLAERCWRSEQPPGSGKRGELGGSSGGAQPSCPAALPEPRFPLLLQGTFSLEALLPPCLRAGALIRRGNRSAWNGSNAL